MSIKNRFFIPVAPFAIADFIRSLENTEEVFNIFITKQDNELVVAYTYDPYRVKRVVSELDNTTCCNDDEPDESWEREKAPEYE